MAIDENAGKIALTSQQLEGLLQAKVTAKNLMNEVERQIKAGLTPQITVDEIRDNISQIEKLLAIYG
jgi:hypothetical protein